MDEDGLIDLVRHAGGELVELTQRLIAFPSVNPPGDMRDIASFVEAYFQQFGIPVERFEPLPGRVSVVASLGSNAGPALAFNGHLDVVPSGERSAWKFDPFRGTVEDGVLYGRGAADMKSKVAAAMVVTRIMHSNGLPTRGSWVVMLVPDEESGGEWGTRWLLANDVVKVDAAIVGEGAGRHYGVANKGTLRVDLRVRGRAAHGSRPFEGSNAIEGLARLLPAVHGIEQWDLELPREVLEIVELSRPFHIENARKRGLSVDLYLNALRRITVNVGMFHGGISRNVVADEAVAALDIRYPPGVSEEQVLGRLRELLGLAGRDDLTVEVIASSPPFYQDLDAPIVRLAREALQAVGVSEEPCPVFKGSANDCRHLKAAGIPCVVLGHDGSGGHVPNEHCDVKDIVDTACLYAVMAHRYTS